MGWIVSHPHHITRGRIADAIEVKESAGDKSERLTPTGQLPTKMRPTFTIPRRNRAVHATRAAALKETSNVEA